MCRIKQKRLLGPGISPPRPCKDTFFSPIRRPPWGNCFAKVKKKRQTPSCFRVFLRSKSANLPPSGGVQSPLFSSLRSPSTLRSLENSAPRPSRTSTTIENSVVVLEFSIVVLVRPRAARGIMRPAGAVAGAASVPYSKLSDMPAIS